MQGKKIINESFFTIHYIEVISQKTGQRVMDSITKYIESKLLLKVNRKKSKIGRPIEIKYLGFTFYNQFKAKKYKAKAHEKSVQKVVRKWNDQRQNGKCQKMMPLTFLQKSFTIKLLLDSIKN